ncbi:unnamed protein product [Heterobilharzia americana]|nr:unnamed protein product [Heterobilharzia americana]
MFATVAAFMFFNGQSSQDYTRYHSTWHILIGLSLACFLPWSFRWRIALSPIISVHIPLSCGTLSEKYMYSVDASNTNSLAPVEITPEASGVIPCTILQDDSHNFANGYTTIPKSSRKLMIISKLVNLSTVISQCLLKAYQKFTSQLDAQLHLNFILDPVCSRWPKLKWILPYGYKSTNTISSSAQTD